LSAESFRKARRDGRSRERRLARAVKRLCFEA